MATTLRIPWNDGNGNIVLTYNGQGNDTVTVTSDTNNLGKQERRQQISFYVTDHAIYNDIVTSQNHRLVTSDGHVLTAILGSLKVTVTIIQPTGLRALVSANNHYLLSANSYRLLVRPAT